LGLKEDLNGIPTPKSPGSATDTVIGLEGKFGVWIRHEGHVGINFFTFFFFNRYKIGPPQRCIKEGRTAEQTPFRKDRQTSKLIKKKRTNQ
jgi:hypothetical protein